MRSRSARVKVASPSAPIQMSLRSPAPCHYLGCSPSPSQPAASAASWGTSSAWSERASGPSGPCWMSVWHSAWRLEHNKHCVTFKEFVTSQLGPMCPSGFVPGGEQGNGCVFAFFFRLTSSLVYGRYDLLFSLHDLLVYVAVFLLWGMVQVLLMNRHTK